MTFERIDDEAPRRSSGTRKSALRQMLADAVRNTSANPVPPVEQTRPVIPQAPAKMRRRTGRPIQAIDIKQKRDRALSSPPSFRLVCPTELNVEPAYQRDLSGKSLTLIRKIVVGWDWAKFKVPICAETDDGLFIIDGQHTAIAAASHPEIKKIPIMIVSAAAIERRAEAFVAHNRDRVVMSPFQILHAEAAAGGKEAKAIIKIAACVGASIPRAAPPKGAAKSGDVISINELRKIFTTDGSGILERILRIAVTAGMAPLAQTVTRALRIICRDPNFVDVAKMPDVRIASALSSISDIDRVAREFAIESGQGRDRACAALIAKASA